MPDHLLYTSISLGMVGLIVVSIKIPYLQRLFAILFSLWITILVLFGAKNIARQAIERSPLHASEEHLRGYREGALQAEARLRLYNGSLLIAGWAVTLLCLVRSSSRPDERSFKTRGGRREQTAGESPL